MGGIRAGGPAGDPSRGKSIDLQPDVVQQFLLKTSLFNDPGVVFGISDRLEAYEVEAGTQIVRVGSPGDWIGILARGRAHLASVNAATGEQTALEPLRPGDHFGEIGPLLGAAQVHAVIADEPCAYMLIPNDVLQTLLGKVPSFSQALAKRLAMRVVQLGVVAIRAADIAERASKAPSEPARQAEQALPSDVIPFVEVSSFEPTPNVIATVPERMILEQRLLPLELSDTALLVGMVTPHNEAAVTELRRVLHRVEPRIVAISHDDFQHALVRFRLVGTGADGRQAAAGAIRPENLTFDIVDSEREADKAIRVIGDEVVRAVNKILCTAIEREASDIHIEPDTGGVKVRVSG